jgi:hypothetical protein
MMGKTGAQRQAELRERQKQGGLTERINVMISPEAKKQFDELTDRYCVTQGQMLERVIRAYYRSETTATEQAKALLAECGGELTKAREALLNRLKVEYPGFSPAGKETKKGERFYPAQREYAAIGSALNVLAREGKKGNGETGQLPA